MGIKGSGNLLWRPELLAFKKIMHVAKTKCELTKYNASRAHPIVVIDANLIAHKAPKDFDMAKHAEMIASAFSVDSMRAMVMVDDPVRRHDSKRESARRRCEKDRVKMCLLEKRSELSSMLQNLTAANQAKSESLSKEARILERKLSRSSPSTFADELAAIACSKSSEKMSNLKEFLL